MQSHRQACSPTAISGPLRSPRCYSTDALIDVALADQGYIHVLDVFVNRLLSQGKLVEVFPGWQTCEHSFFTVILNPCTPTLQTG